MENSKAPYSFWSFILPLFLAIAAPAQPRYVEVATEVGIAFEHRNGAEGKKLLPETMGSGVAFFDYDADGWLDLYFVNAAAHAALYWNEGNGRFANRTEEAEVENSGYGMGVVAADYDNDGDQDLYITCYGANILYRNDGNGRFVDVTTAAGVGDEGFGTGAAFGDWDLDGDLDLYVANYLDCRADQDRTCFRQDTVRVYCAPWTYAPEPDVFYRNDGDHFAEISAEVGLLPDQARELGVVFTDYDLDGDLDLYAAGDGTPNMLYQNAGGRFEERGLIAGTAYNREGKSEAGMGVAVGDYNNDGAFDFFVTNFYLETNTLYHNEGNGFFLDRTTAAKLGKPSLAYLAWGTAFFDWDLDGDEDLFVANGHMDDNVERFEATTYAQRNQLFRNDGEAGFTDISNAAGPGLEGAQSSRGAALGDWDNDGDLDIAVVHINEPASLLRNDRDNKGNWLAIRTLGTVSNRDGVGTRIRVRAGDLVQVREVRRGGSYLSSHDPRIFFGLGERVRVDEVEIRWPSGKVQRLEGVEAGQILLVEEAR
jgi:hypothetical protein